MSVKSREPWFYTLDTSVLVKTFLLDEELVEEANAVLDAFGEGRCLLVMPVIAQYEASSTILKAVRERQISDEAARVALETLFDLRIPVVGDLNETRDMVLRAYPVAREIGGNIYKAIFLVLSATVGAPLITADRELFDASRGTFDVIWLGDFELS